jgi:hypothetical protein
MELFGSSSEAVDGKTPFMTSKKSAPKGRRVFDDAERKISGRKEWKVATMPQLNGR